MSMLKKLLGLDIREKGLKVSKAYEYCKLCVQRLEHMVDSHMDGRNMFAPQDIYNQIQETNSEIQACFKTIADNYTPPKWYEEPNWFPVAFNELQIKYGMIVYKYNNANKYVVE